MTGQGMRLWLLGDGLVLGWFRVFTEMKNNKSGTDFFAV